MIRAIRLWISEFTLFLLLLPARSPINFQLASDYNLGWPTKCGKVRYNGCQYFVHNPADIFTGSPTILEPPQVPDSFHHNDGGPPPPKRRKIPLACSACRDRKSRCDGIQPTCSACEKRKTANKCLYEESTLKTQRWAHSDGLDCSETSRMNFNSDNI
jgi:hypothetical protein